MCNETVLPAFAAAALCVSTHLLAEAEMEVSKLTWNWKLSVRAQFISVVSCLFSIAAPLFAFVRQQRQQQVLN
jgi:hypothetical protein